MVRELRAALAGVKDSDAAAAGWQAVWALEGWQPDQWEAAREAFGRSVAARMQRDGAEAAQAWLKEQAEAWWKQGRLAWAEGATDERLALLSKAGSSEDYAVALEEAARQFRLKDVAYAQAKVGEYVGIVAQAGGRRAMDRLLAKAREWAVLAEADRVAGNNLVRTVFAIPEALLRAVEERFGTEALGEEGLLLLADCVFAQRWYDMGWDRAATEYERFLQRFPGSRRWGEAAVNLIRCDHILSQKKPEYLPRAQELTEQVIERFPGSEEAGWALYELGMAYRYHRRWAEAYHCFSRVLNEYVHTKAALSARGLDEEAQKHLQGGGNQP